MLTVRRRALLWGFAVIAFAPARSLGQSGQVTGTFTVIWADAARSAAPPSAPMYVVIDDAGRWTRVEIPDARLRALGGVRALQNARVHVSGTVDRSVRGLARALPRIRAASVQRLSAAPASAVVAQTGSHPIVTILCAYPDSTTPMLPKEVFQRWLEPGAAYPGIDDVYRELSFGQFNLSGSIVVGWYRLPHPYDFYWTSSGFDLSAMATDCTAAADADVDFPRFAGINVQTSGPGQTSYGTAGLTIDRDGQRKVYGFTWVNSPTPAGYEHEIGHTLGWPHSQGGYGASYDSKWDVMSNLYLFFDYSTSPQTWVGQHTIAANKEYAGWIPSSRIYSPELPSTRHFVLERLAKPASTTNVLEVKVPMSSPAGQFYTIEARRFSGYDEHLPGEGVILHTVDYTRPEWAWVVDVDHNGDPNDAGAMWTPSEEFSDSLNGLTVRVNSATASGYDVIVTRGWQLAVQSSGPGAVRTASGDCTGACSYLFASRGQSATLTAVPSASATFAGWSGACTGTSLSCTVTLLGNRSVTARFGSHIAITTDSTLPPATMGAAYDFTFGTSLGSGGVTWSAGGALPPGLALDAGTGRNTGVPSEAGSFTFSLGARAGELSTSKAFGLTVTKPALAESAVLDVLLGASTALSEDQLRFLDLLGNHNGRFDIGDARAWLIDDGVLAAGSTLAQVVPALEARETTHPVSMAHVAGHAGGKP